MTLDVSPIGFEYSTFLANNKTEEVEDHLEFEFNEEGMIVLLISNIFWLKSLFLDLYPQPEQSDDGKFRDLLPNMVLWHIVLPADDETSSYEYEEKVVSCFTDFSSHPRAIPIPG